MTDEERQLFRDARESIDILFAALMTRDDKFFPSHSGKPWDTIRKINLLLVRESVLRGESHDQ